MGTAQPAVSAYAVAPVPGYLTATTTAVAPAEDLKPSAYAAHVQGEIVTNMLVPHNKAGQVIGKGGEIISSIRETSGATVQVSEHTGLPERMVTIQGNFPNVHAAYNLVLRHTMEEGAEMHTMKLAVTHDDAGGLIGKGGSTINELRMALGGATNCLQVEPADPSHPDQRSVILNGSYAVLLRGHELVCERILERARRKAEMSAATGGTQGSSNAVVPGMSSSAAQGASTTPANVVPVQVQVPNDSIGNVIGRAGSRISEIRNLSGARIHIDAAQPGNPNRLVTITGTNEQNQWAQYMISVAMAGGEPSMAMAGGTGGTDGYSAAAYGASGYGTGVATATGVSTGAKAAPVQTQVPNDSMGNVIGRNGSNISHIRQLSGATIHIGDIQMNSPYRLVTISGTPEQTQIANYLINMAMGGGDVRSWGAGDVAYVLGQQAQAAAPAGTSATAAGVQPQGTADTTAAAAAAAYGGYGMQQSYQGYDANAWAQYYQQGQQQS